MPFQLPYMQTWTVLSNRDYTGFKPELLASKVRLHTPWATEQTCSNFQVIVRKLLFINQKSVNLSEKE